MRIDPNSPVRPAAAPTRRASGGAFALAEPEAERTRAPAAAVPAVSLDAVLALQEDDGERRRRGARRGHALLDDLDRLKAALLAGRVPGADLRRLAGRLADRPETSGDPRLDDLLAHIELRARVELAKLGSA